MRPRSKVPLVPVPESTSINDRQCNHIGTPAAFNFRRRSQRNTVVSSTVHLGEQRTSPRDCMNLNNETKTRNRMWGGSDWSRKASSWLHRQRLGQRSICATGTDGCCGQCANTGAKVVTAWRSVAPQATRGVTTQSADGRSRLCEERANAAWRGPQWALPLSCLLLVMDCLGSLPPLASPTLPPVQRQALVDLYNATSGPAWLYKWAAYNSSSDPCAGSWFGVACDASMETVTYVRVDHCAVAVRRPCCHDGWQSRSVLMCVPSTR